MGAGPVAVGGRHTRSPGGGSLAAASSPAPASPAAIRRRGHRCCGQGLCSGAPSPPGSLRARSPLAFRPGESLGLGLGRFPGPGGVCFGARTQSSGLSAAQGVVCGGDSQPVTQPWQGTGQQQGEEGRSRRAGQHRASAGSPRLWGRRPNPAPRPQSKTSTPGPCSGFKCPFPASL